MKILLLGASGQLGCALAATLARRCDLVCASRNATGNHDLFVDFLRPKTVLAALTATKPDIVINAAAYTAVDQAEDDRANTWCVNADTVAEIAMYMKRQNALFVHFSTDYVFSGTASRAYREIDPVYPCNHYGVSKLAGEEAIRCSGVDHLIFRTSWLYALSHRNFLTAILSKANNNQPLRVVDDQIGQPTSVDFLCRSLQTLLIERNDIEWIRARTGTYHLSSSGHCSWFDFAKEIVAHSNEPSVKLERTTTAEFPSRARRPNFSVLAHDKVAHVLGLVPPFWRDEANCLLSNVTGSCDSMPTEIHR